MAVTLTIQGITYTFPADGEAPGWGAEATEAVVAIVDALTGLQAPGDIAPTQATISNNQTSFANVGGLLLPSSQIRAAFVEYFINRTTASAEVDEVGKIYLIYRTNTNDWELARTSTGDAGVDLEITPAGQIRYKSSNLAGASYQGKMKFRARSLSL